MALLSGLSIEHKIQNGLLGLRPAEPVYLLGMRSDRDPFEGVRLDDGFIRAARFIEPSAADRAPTGDARRSGRCQVVSARKGLPGIFHRFVWLPRLRSRHRARVVAVVALVLGMLGFGVLLFRQSAGRASQGAAGVNPAAGPAIEVTAMSSAGPVAPGDAFVHIVLSVPAARAAAPGDCLTWVPLSAGTVVTDEVACSELHRGEVTKIIDLAGWSSTWPGQHEIDALAAQQCATTLPGHFGVGRSAFVPQAGSLHVAEEDWAGDARVLVCLVVNQQGTPWSGSARTSGATA